MVNKLSYYPVQEPKMIGPARINKKGLSPLLNELATPILVPVNGHVGPDGVNVAPMVWRIDKEDVKIRTPSKSNVKRNIWCCNEIIWIWYHNSVVIHQGSAIFDPTINFSSLKKQSNLYLTLI